MTELLYNGVCNVYEYKQHQKPNKSTGFTEELVLQDIPCRLTHRTISSVNQNENGGALVQVNKLILSPDVVINAGSKIVVTQCGKTDMFQLTGEPAYFHTHQEIELEIFKGWA